jgi:IS30 family transposase
LIWQDKHSGGTLYKHLRHRAKKYNKRSSKTGGRGIITNRIDIDQRPPIVDTKSRIGDFELDTIVGSNHQGAIVSIVERHAI